MIVWRRAKLQLLSISFALLVAAIVIWLSSFGASAHGQQLDQARSVDQPTGLAAITTSATHVAFELHTRSFWEAIDGSLHVEALSHRLSTPGEPDLPYFQTTVAIPPDAKIDLAYTARGTVERPIADVQPVASLTIPGGFQIERGSTDLNRVASVYQPDNRIYTNDALFPAAVVELSEPFYIRDVRLVNVKVFPLRYNPVQQELVHIPELQITLTFNHLSAPRSGILPATQSPHIESTKAMVLNPDYVSMWQETSAVSARASSPTNDVPLPAGETVYKLTLDHEGIYDVTQAELVAAGFDMNTDPDTIQLMHNGQIIAYQLLNDNGDAIFDANETIRFYGWPFDESRSEKQFVAENIYWLWAENTAAARVTTAPPLSASEVVTTHQAVVQREVDDVFSSTRIGTESSFINGPDSFYWIELLRDANTEGITKTLSFDLPYPAETGPDATFVYESMAEDRSVLGIARFKVNDWPEIVEKQFVQQSTFLVTQTVPISEVNHLTNTVRLENLALSFTLSSNNTFLLNAITVHYPSYLTAWNDQLRFEIRDTGGKTYEVDGLSSSTAAEIAIWDITERTSPVVQTITNSGPAGTHQFGFSSAGADPDQLIVVGPEAIQMVNNISRYTVTDMTPPNGYAEWVAITDGSLITAAHALADHRASFTNLITHVVDIEDVVNQYGYGFKSSQTLKDYLQSIYDGWTTPPAYVTLVGDAHYNPRLLPCGGCDEGGSRANWETTNPSLIPANYSFVDRFQGLVPSDYDYTLLAGDDLMPDLAIGRLSVETLTDAEHAVNKIIRYENNLSLNATWQREILFVHDWPNDYDFEAQVDATLPHIPDDFDVKVMGLSERPSNGNDPNLIALRNNMFNEINATTIVNWRGHGSVSNWSSPNVLNTSDTEGTFINNVDIPMVTISMDCLDGNFIYPEWNSLSESLLRMDQMRGSAAHWSSSGLGFPEEHLNLAEHFYTALFDLGLTSIGDAISHAKSEYLLAGLHESEAYSFTLQGDPAMQLYKPALALDADAMPDTIPLQSETTIVITATNHDIMNSTAGGELLITLPESLNYVNHSATTPVNLTLPSVPGEPIRVSLPTGLPANEITVIELTVLPTQTGPQTIMIEFYDSGTRLNTAATLMVDNQRYYLPLIINP